MTDQKRLLSRLVPNARCHITSSRPDDLLQISIMTQSRSDEASFPRHNLRTKPEPARNGPRCEDTKGLDETSVKKLSCYQLQMRKEAARRLSDMVLTHQESRKWSS
ncbi:hypothetical protein CLAIMM_12145 [Cladophialophora immunda]|nr:hypothetical protein CLAIMM_12145 [Cladophialophora immunda]